MPIKKIALTFILLVFYHLLSAQGLFYGSNLFEFQLGNLPQLEPKDQFSLFDQTNLGYRYKTFSFQARIEQYYPSFEPAEKYVRLSQLKLQHISKHIDLQIGHHYSSLGRGLLLRSYEIPGSIWETRGYRVRYGFYKDMLGATLKLNFSDFEMKILGGKVLDVTLPPTLDDFLSILGNTESRRPDLVGGIESSYRIKKQKIGLIYMIDQASGGLGATKNISHYASIFYNGIIAKKIYLYSELAQRLESGIQPFPFSDEAGYGGYIGINYSAGNLGASLEYKNYHNIFIGTGINDPPTLVKEQSYRLLNRSTHVPDLTDESGYQLELYYRLESGNIITFNSALSKNYITASKQPTFLEFFSEYQFYPNENLSGKIFVDYSKDPFVNEINRYASGGNIEISHNKLNSTFELEWQLIDRMTIKNIYFSNWYLYYGLSRASKFTASVLFEITGDPIQLNNNKKHTMYPSTSFSYHFTRKNVLTLFYGKRRGGPACNSGVCYDVLSFEGLEARFTTRF